MSTQEEAEARPGRKAMSETVRRCWPWCAPGVKVLYVGPHTNKGCASASGVVIGPGLNDVLVEVEWHGWRGGKWRADECPHNLEPLETGR